MAKARRLICSSHTISGVMPGAATPARHGFEARVAACAAAGYDGMCLHFRDYRALRHDGREDAELAEILARHAMTDISLEFLVDWFLEGTAGAQAREDEATAYAAARAYGARSLNVGSDFLARGVPPRVMRRRFAALAGRAGEHGLSVALEIVPWSDVPTVAAALDMIGDAENAGLVVDCWHVFRGGVPLADIAALPARRILCVQVNDADAEPQGALVDDTRRRKPCGEGAFDLPAFLDAIDRTGATPPLSVEIIAPEFAALDVAEAAERSIGGVRRLVDRR